MGVGSNREVRLLVRPNGVPRPSDFEIVEASRPEPADGQVLVEVHWISVDPMMRILIDEKPLGGAFPGLPLGSTPPGPAVGQVIASAYPGLKPGDMVEGRLGWREFAVSDGARLRKLDLSGLPQQYALGVLGLPGFTAFAGLSLFGDLTKKRVLVSGAAGAVGSVVGPLVSARGGTAVGIASGPLRCAALTERLGYAVAIDRSRPDFSDVLRATAGDGFDGYFENVGGQLFTEALSHLKRRGRVVVCGLMAQYVAEGRETREALGGALETMMARSLAVEAFSNTDYAHLQPQFEAEMMELIRAGAIHVEERVRAGLDAVPDAFCSLFTEAVIGKSLVRVR